MKIISHLYFFQMCESALECLDGVMRFSRGFGFKKKLFFCVFFY